MADNDIALRTDDSSPKVVETSATAIDTSKIVGWGVDADPDNDPTYPYRERSSDDHSGQWRRPARQEPEVELLHSIEHKQTPAVFGTSSPPKWISGWMRRLVSAGIAASAAFRSHLGNRNAHGCLVASSRVAHFIPRFLARLAK